MEILNHFTSPPIILLKKENIHLKVGSGSQNQQHVSQPLCHFIHFKNMYSYVCYVILFEDHLLLTDGIIVVTLNYTVLVYLIVKFSIIQWFKNPAAQPEVGNSIPLSPFWARLDNP